MTFDMRHVLGCAAAAVLLALPACDGGESEAESETTTGPTAGVVTITMTDDDCDYDGPESVSDGHLTVELVKETDTDGSFELLRIDGRSTFDELEGRIEDDSERIERGQQPVGYHGLASLEASAELIGPDDQHVLTPMRQDLEPGAHAFLCIQPSGLGVAGPLELVP
ncbi:MAG: hypothetical protein ACRDPZ_10790 [Gaiellaceae bacterium]